MMKQKQLKFQNSNSPYINEPMDNTAKLRHDFNHLPTCHHASQPFMPRIRQELHNNALYKSGTPTVPPCQQNNLKPVDINVM